MTADEEITTEDVLTTAGEEVVTTAEEERTDVVGTTLGEDGGGAAPALRRVSLCGPPHFSYVAGETSQWMIAGGSMFHSRLPAQALLH